MTSHHDHMSPVQQAEQVEFYLYLFCVVVAIIGIVRHGYFSARSSTPESQRKHSRKVFLVLLAGLVFISLMRLGRILTII